MNQQNLFERFREPMADSPAQTAKALGGVGILTPQDLAELSAGTQRVAELMRDGLWHNANEIRQAAGTNGVPASEGTRRLRELRQIPSVEIERRKVEGSRLFEYRIVRGSTP